MAYLIITSIVQNSAVVLLLRLLQMTKEIAGKPDIIQGYHLIIIKISSSTAREGINIIFIFNRSALNNIHYDDENREQD